MFGAGPLEPLKDKIKLGLDIKGGVYVVMEAQTDLTGDKLASLMEQTQAVIENRVNKMGLSEPIVTIEGTKRIRVELPGAEDAEQAIDMIGQTAQLEFLLADGREVLDGSMIKDASTTTDHERGGFAVSLEFNPEGAKRFEEGTRTALSGSVVSQFQGIPGQAILIVLDGEIISSPTVQTVISNGSAVITAGKTGGFPQDEATKLAALIRGGKLPVALEEVDTSIQTAVIGENALEMSVIAGFIGLLLIFVIMVVGYMIMGVAANIALLLYVILDLWCLIAMGAVLTLPGIAGIILSIGMAVDANVIIFTRIKEEICNGKSIRVSIQSGFKRAMSTILDSQITTIIAAVVLYQIGSSTVKGFALTLMVGIVVSIFTAVAVTQLYLGLIGEMKAFGKKSFFGVEANNRPKFVLKKQFSIIKNRKIFYMVSIGIIVIGLAVGGIRGFNMGIDFTGGTMMQFDMGQKVSTEDVNRVLKQHNINDATIVFAGENMEQVVVRTTVSLDNNERKEVIGGVKEAFNIGDDGILAVNQFGPSVGKELEKNAVKAVLLASLGMLIYIVFRFEWKFGVASLVGVFHDVLIVLAFYGIFHVTVNNPFIAGILTVVGYSINDTIVVFDRVRENLGIMKKNKLEELLDASINQTLSRSIMTSFTTLVVMIPLFILTGNTIREFILPLMVGIIAGCTSSIFTCSPIYYDICNYTGGSKYKSKVKKIKEDKKG